MLTLVDVCRDNVWRCAELGAFQGRGAPDVKPRLLHPWLCSGTGSCTRMGFFSGGLLLPVRSPAAQEPGTEHTWLLSDVFLPKHIGLKDISRRSAWINDQSNHGPYGARQNKGKLQTVQTECRKRQAVKRNIESYSPAGC